MCTHLSSKAISQTNQTPRPLPPSNTSNPLNSRHVYNGPITELEVPHPRVTEKGACKKRAVVLFESPLLDQQNPLSSKTHKPLAAVCVCVCEIPQCETRCSLLISIPLSLSLRVSLSKTLYLGIFLIYLGF